MKNVADKIRGAESAVRKQLDELHQAISDTKQEIDWIQSSPPPRDETLLRLATSIDAEATRFFSGATNGELIHEGRIGEFLRSATDSHSNHMLPGFFCWLLGDELKARVAAAFGGDGLDFEEGPPTTERPELIAAAQQRLLALEREEEGLIEQAEAAGFEIIRRADADPAIVLDAQPVHRYRFKATAKDCDEFRGAVESDETLSRSAIESRARHMLPRGWIEKNKLFSLELLDIDLSGDIVADDEEPLSEAPAQ